jgi:hypothetical protein
MGDLETQAARGQAGMEVAELDVEGSAPGRPGQGPESRELVDAVHELGLEVVDRLPRPIRRQ